MRLRPLVTATLAATALFASPAGADTPAPGYSLEVLPGGGPYRTVALSNGEFVGHDSNSVERFAEDGALIQTLHVFGNSATPSEIVVDPTETFALVCRDLGQYGAWTYRVDLGTGDATFLASVTSSSVVFESPNTALMSVINGFTHSIQRLDLTTGQLTQVSWNFAGSNVSIDLDAAGNLYVAYTFQTVAGDGYVERFEASMLAGPGLIFAGDGTVVADQLGESFGLAVTDDGQNYYTVETTFGVDKRLVQLGKGGRRLLATIDQGVNVWDVQLVRPSPPVAQVLGGPRLPGELIYQSQPGGVFQRVKVTPAGNAPVTIGPVQELKR